MAVDLGQDAVEDEVVELLLAADVAVQRAGNHAEAGGQGAHAEGLHAVGADDREGLGDDAFAGERDAAAFLLVGWGGEPQQAGAPRPRSLPLVGHVCLASGTAVDCEQCSLYSEQCSSEAYGVHWAVFFRGEHSSSLGRANAA